MSPQSIPFHTCALGHLIRSCIIDTDVPNMSLTNAHRLHPLLLLCPGLVLILFEVDVKTGVVVWMMMAP